MYLVWSLFSHKKLTECQV